MSLSDDSLMTLKVALCLREKSEENKLYPQTREEKIFFLLLGFQDFFDEEGFFDALNKKCFSESAFTKLLLSYISSSSSLSCSALKG